MCHVIRVYTFCPSWVCRDPGGKGKERRGWWREIEIARLVPVPGRWMGHGHPPSCPPPPRPQTSPDVHRPHAARVVDRPKRRRVTAWLITPHGVACSSAPTGPLPNNWSLHCKRPPPHTHFYQEKYRQMQSYLQVSNKRICQWCRLWFLTTGIQIRPLKTLSDRRDCKSGCIFTKE